MNDHFALDTVNDMLFLHARLWWFSRSRNLLAEVGVKCSTEKRPIKNATSWNSGQALPELTTLG